MKILFFIRCWKQASILMIKHNFILKIGLVTMHLLFNRFNTINHITDVSFSGLRKLELLMMHGNNVQKIQDGAFQDLVSLQVKSQSFDEAH